MPQDLPGPIQKLAALLAEQGQDPALLQEAAAALQHHLGEDEPLAARLHTTQMQLDLALELHPTALWDWNPLTDKITWQCGTLGGWNPRCDWIPNTLEGLSAHIHPEERASFVQQWRETCQGRGTVDGTFRLLSPDGVLHPIRIKGRSLQDGRGPKRAVMGVITFNAAVPSRHAQQDAPAPPLAPHFYPPEARDGVPAHSFCTLVDSVPALISYIDASFHYRRANQAYCRWFGRPAEQIQNHHVREVLGEEAWKLVRPHMERALAGEIVTYEQELPYQFSGPRWVHVTYSPNRSANGQVLGFTAHVVDISGRRATEMALRRSEAKLQTIVENLAEGLIAADMNGKLVHWNRAALQMHGFANMEECCRQLNEFTSMFEFATMDGTVLHLEEWPLARVLRGEKLHEMELRLRRLDIDWQRVYRYGGTLVRDGQGQPVMAVLSVIDITERQQAEEAIQAALSQAEENQRLLKALMEYVPEGITIADAPDARIQMVSRYGEAMLGRVHQGLTAEDVARQWTVYQADGVTPMATEELPLVRAIHKGEVVKDQELVQVNQEGQRLTLLCGAGPIRGASGEVIGGVVAWRDITARRQQEAAVRQSEALLRQFLDNSPLPMGLVEVPDEGGDILHVYDNPETCRFFGRAVDSLNGRWSVRDLGSEPKRIGELIEHYRRSARSGAPERFLHAIPRGGETRWLEVVVAPVGRVGEGRMRFCYVCEDITARKQAQEGLLAAKAVAEEANRAKDQFLAVLSHELRTPLTPVLTTAQMLEADARLSAEHRDMIQLIRRNVELEARLIDDLLDLTRITRGKFVLRQAPTDLHDLLVHTLAMLEKEVQAKQIELRIDWRAEQRHVHADPARLQQVIWNLLKNAIKFTPPGGLVQVRTRHHEGQVELVVADTGVGISAAVLPRIFEAFEQGDPQITRQFGGLGLGLAISKALVVMHGGTIAVASEGEGRGATFTVQLPTIPVSPGIPAAPAKPRRPAACNATVLLVEDHPDTRRVMLRMLEAIGCTVQTAGSVAQACNAADTAPFDLLISDIGLPDGSGLEVVRYLKIKQPGIRSIAQSGYGMEEDIRRSQEAGFDVHLTKPVDIQVLQDMVERIAESKKPA